MSWTSAFAYGLLATTSLLGAATAALAQDNPAAPPANGSASGGPSSGDIIVTAQRRSERLRDVPISITALSAETLTKAGVTNTLDLQRVTPGLQLPFYGAFVQPSIRGISSAGAGLNDSSNVAVYVDGIYQPSESGQLQDLPDIQQVEVLKGPQGTLYGQNAEGGAIAINSIAPSFKTSGKISASYGNYNDKTVKGYVTGPITSTIAAEVAGLYEQRDGFNRDLLRGGHDKGLRSRLIRGKLLWQPSDSVSFTLGGYYTQRNDTTFTSNQPLNGDASAYNLANDFGLTIPHTSKPHQFSLDLPSDSLFRTYGVNLRGEFKLGFGTISTVTAYGNVRVRNVADADGTSVAIGNIDLRINHHDFIQEVNFLSAPIGRLKFAAGLFYMNKQESDVPQLFNVQNIGGQPTIYPETPITYTGIGSFSKATNQSYAAYLEATYDITDALTLIAGGRYDYERERNYNRALPSPPGPIAADPRNPFTFKKFTPRVVLRYRLNSTSNIYVSYSQGFKSGFASTGDTVTPPVKPETLTSYEIGYKGKLGNAVTLNIAAYHYDYKNLQVFIYVPPSGFYQNAASARVNGVDFDASAKLGRNFQLSVGAAYIDAKYRKFPTAGVYEPNLVPAVGGNDPVNEDASGNRLTRAPKLTGNVTLNYDAETAAGQFGAYVSAYYNSGSFYDANNRVHQKRYATLAAEASFAPSALKGLRFVLYGRNLTNTNYFSSVLEDNFGDFVSYGDPRTFGGRIEFSF